MAKVKTLLDEVLAAATTQRPGPGTWFEKLPADIQGELAAVRERFRAGELAMTKTALARAIQAVAQSRGFATAKTKGVIEWLERP